MENLENLSPEEKLVLLKLLEQRADRVKHGGHLLKYFPNTGPHRVELYPKHRDFFAAGKEHSERVFMAANRVGKTVAGAYELTCHLTGEYPDWWEGKTFNHPTDCWAAGDTGQTTRDIIQTELLGPYSEGDGMIARDKLGKKVMRAGSTSGAVDTIQIKHVTGGWSRLGFKSYDQKRRSFQGTGKHAVWLDEECPLDVYDESNMRIMTTGGVIYVTFTPLMGLTQFIQNFQKAAALSTYE